MSLFFLQGSRLAFSALTRCAGLGTRQQLSRSTRFLSCSLIRHQQEPANQSPVMKYILVTGGVISGIGKGVIASSIGTTLKSCGIRVTSIKIDPYINIDAGTFSPYEHGKLLLFRAYCISLSHCTFTWLHEVIFKIGNK